MLINFSLNGKKVESNSPPHRCVIDLLREEFQLRSLHQNCGNAHCGTCLILLDDNPVSSCFLPVFELRDRQVWTMEGISLLKEYSDLVAGFRSSRVELCEACAPAQALATEALLRKSKRPNAKQIRETAAMVPCPCHSTARLLNAILYSSHHRELRSRDTTRSKQG